ncbi:MAG: adenylyltransferase/cytidyltransferase family protein [Sulfitobacter sp.]|nr:adenylyltransferase/cytidyltransferase family protein [Sulfitobacter sp.]
MNLPVFSDPRVVLTYGRFDLFDQDHAQFLRSIRGLGDELIVGCASDTLARAQGTPCQMPFEARRAMLTHCRFVDRVIVQTSEAQKRTDIVNYNVSALVMGEEHLARFDHLSDIAEVRYLPRKRASAAAISWQPGRAFRIGA